MTNCRPKCQIFRFVSVIELVMQAIIARNLSIKQLSSNFDLWSIKSSRFLLDVRLFDIWLLSAVDFLKADILIMNSVTNDYTFNVSVPNTLHCPISKSAKPKFPSPPFWPQLTITTKLTLKLVSSFYRKITIQKKTVTQKHAEVLFVRASRHSWNPVVVLAPLATIKTQHIPPPHWPAIRVWALRRELADWLTNWLTGPGWHRARYLLYTHAH